MGSKPPGITYRLAMAVINRALRDLIYKSQLRTQKDHESAKLFLLDPRSSPWFKRAALNQDWFRCLFTTDGLERKHRILAMIYLTEYSNFCEHSPGGATQEPWW